MTWFGWLMIIFGVLEIAGKIAIIGLPRRPVTSSDALAVLLINAAVIAGILAIGTGSL